MTSNRVAIIAGGVLAAFFVLSLVTFTVRSTEVAAVTTFGRPGRPITGAGLYLKLPWPIQRVYKFDARVQDFESKFEETYTQDGKTLLVMVYAGWRIADPIVFLKRVGTSADARRYLEGLIRTYKNGVLGRHPFVHLVSLNPKDLHFEDVEQEMLKAIQREARQQYGIDVQFLGIKMLGLPETITQKVFDRMRKERESIAEKYRAEGLSAAAEIRAAADVKSKRILAEAEAKATRIRGEGDAEAAKHYGVFQQDPQLAIFLRKLAALENTLKDRSTVVLDPRTPPYDLMQSPGGAKAK